jgi:hypothetical protein
VAEALAKMRRDGERAIARRLAKAQKDGDLSKSVDTKALASYVTAVLHGMTIKARDSGFQRKLESIARQAMASWPAG